MVAAGLDIVRPGHVVGFCVGRQVGDQSLGFVGKIGAVLRRHGFERLVDEDGSARQAALDGGFHLFPRSFFVTGSLAGVPVPCVSVAAQRLFHAGYELRGIDRHDLAVLDELDRGGMGVVESSRLLAAEGSGHVSGTAPPRSPTTTAEPSPDARVERGSGHLVAYYNEAPITARRVAGTDRNGLPSATVVDPGGGTWSCGFEAAEGLFLPGHGRTAAADRLGPVRGGDGGLCSTFLSAISMTSSAPSGPK